MIVPEAGEQAIAHAADILVEGGVIVYPTETVYGLGCDPFNEDACNRIQRLKGREETKTLLLLASRLSLVEELTSPLSDTAAQLAERFWPGPLTLVLNPSTAVPGWLVGPSGGVAFRVTPDPVAAPLIDLFGRPVVSTSANSTGMPPLASAGEAARQFGGDVDLILDGGVRKGVPSTIVDLTGKTPRLLRVGAIREDDLNEVF